MEDIARHIVAECQRAKFPKRFRGLGHFMLRKCEGTHEGESMTAVSLINRPKTARGSRTAERPRIGKHYWAFLSYSHADAETADWLHEAIEDFRVPPALVGKLTENGPVPRRLTPVFRDRHELAASGDLSDEIVAAITGSRFLIVLCSPAAAKSHWTNAEIDCFKRVHPDACVLAAIVGGEPFASDIAGREAEECFPPALKVQYDRRGRPTAKRAEPVAADLREGKDGRSLGLLKIIAGMLGLRLDDLVQRDTHRRQRRMAWLTAASIVGMVVTSGLAVVAVQSRDAARDERREADSLIGFMLGDLRERLEPLGRLDLLDAVGERALAYYERQDKGSLSDDALAKRAKALTLMGEIANTRGDLRGALGRYREAMATTGEAVRRYPDDPQRLFDHAQNVFWVGYIDFQRGAMDGAAQSFREYRSLADRMIAAAPNEPKYRLEQIYADTNLGAVLVDQRRYAQAAEVYQASLETIGALVASKPDNVDYLKQQAETLAYLADSRASSGQIEDAIGLRQKQLQVIDRVARTTKDDTNIKRQELAARRSMARLLAERGQTEAALAEADRAREIIRLLIRTEPDNTEWVQAAGAANAERAHLELAVGRVDQAQATVGEVCRAADALIKRDRMVANWRLLETRCLLLRARVALRGGATSAALPLARDALSSARGQKNPIDRRFELVSANLALGDALRAAGDSAASAGAYQSALAAFPPRVELQPRELAQRATLLRRLGKDAGPVERQLAAMGYRHPDYVQHR